MTIDKCILCGKDLIQNPDRVGYYMGCPVNCEFITTQDPHYWYGLIHDGILLDGCFAKISIKNFSISFSNKKITILDSLNDEIVMFEGDISIFNSFNCLEAIQNFLLLQ